MNKEICAETTANLFSRLTFSWMNRFMKRGYQRPLTEDTVDELHPDLRASLAVDAFQRHWGGLNLSPKRLSNDSGEEENESRCYDTPKITLNKGRALCTQECNEKQRNERHGEHSSLLRALWRTFGSRLLFIQLWQLLHDCIWFTTPFVLGKLIEFMRNEDASSYRGYLLAILLYLSALLRSICDKQVFHSSGCLALKVRAALLSAVYRKALRLDVTSRQRRSAGEIVSLMSEDCEQLEVLVTWLYQMWSAPLQLVVSLSLLYFVLGPAVFAGVAVIIVLVPVNIFILKCLRKSSSELMNLRDSRIKILSEVLNGIKVLKMYAWEPAFCEKIENCRKKELYLLWRNAIWDMFLHCSWTVAPYFITLAFFFTYLHTNTDQYLRPETVFMTLTVIKFITVAINIAPALLSDAIKAAVSIGRLQTFLNQSELEEREDCKNQILLSRDAHENCAVLIHQGTFSWGLTLPPTLKDVSLAVTPGSLVAVVGSVGSGKSSLLAAILGEMDRLSGKVHAEGVIAYVPQQAWIQHDTVRNNVLFGSAMDRQRYEACVSACALEPDLDILPGGDLTEIGERGINLSGGQKQRVSLARAIYSQADLFLLDDPLSSVDAHVGRHIFRRVIGNQGLLKEKTRILVTHGVHWLPEVDVIVMMAEGRIVEVGEYRQLVGSCGPFAAYLRQCLTRSPGGEGTSDSDEEVQAIKSVMLQRLLSWSDERTSPLPSPVSPSSPLWAKATTTSPAASPPASAGPERTFPSLKSQTPTSNLSSSETLNRDAGYGCSTDGVGKRAPAPSVGEIDDFAGKGASSVPLDRGTDVRERRKTVKESSFDIEDFEEFEDDDEGFQFLSSQAEEKERRDRQKANILQNKHKLVEAETLADKTVPWRVYRELLTTIGWRSVVVISLVFAAHYVASTLADVVLRAWTDDPRLVDLTSFPPGSQERATINGEYLRSYVICGLSLTVLMVTYKVLQKSRMLRLSRALHSGMLRSVMRAPVTYFDVTPQGRLISRFSRDVRVVDEELHHSTSGTLEASCLVLSGLAVMVASAPWVALPLAPLLLFYLYVQRYYIASSRQLKRLSSRSRSPMYSFFSESLQGASVIRAFGARERFEKRMESLCDENTRFRYYSYCSNRWLGFRLDLLGGLCVLMTSLTGVALRHALSPGVVGLAVTHALSVTANLYFFVMSLGDLENEVVCLERIAEVSNMDHEAPWTIEGRLPRKTWPETGLVEMADIDLRYRPGLDLALKGVSFSIQGGKKVGIVGRTGAGKSSLTLALFRLLEVSKGHTDIDDLDIGSIGLHDLRDKIAVIPQDPTVFAGSIRSNLDPFSHHSDHDLWQALTHAHLQPFVSSLPLGLDSDCGEGGENLSLGQRQLLCLARALLRRTKILVLDEATAAVDMATDQVIQQTLRSEFAHCTVLTIAHRLNTVMDYDKILVLDEGRVVSFDSPLALLQDPDSLFSRLVASAGHQQQQQH